MAKKIENEKGFLVLEVSHIECITKLGGYGICDSCNKASTDGYYIAVLNHWVCPECYKEWIGRAKRYANDIPIEERNYAHYSKRLGVCD